MWRRVASAPGEQVENYFARWIARSGNELQELATRRLVVPPHEFTQLAEDELLVHVRFLRDIRIAPRDGISS